MQLPQWQTKSQQWLTDSGQRSIRATKRPMRKRPMASDKIIEYAVQYAQDGSYPLSLTKEKKRAVRKRAALLRVDKDEVFFNCGERRVKVVISRDGQRRVLMACHSEPTSGHFGVTCVIDAYKVLYMHNSIVCHFNLLLHIS